MPKKTKRGKAARNKGHAYERQIVNEFKALGVDCGTSRLHSKALDDAKVDICFLEPFPLNIQCKNNSIYHNPVPVLKAMPEDENYNVIFQKVFHGGEWVTMKKEDFMEIVQLLIMEKLWKK